MNIAIFGGSFNPVHMGHYEIVRFLTHEKRFHKVIIIPAYQNPLKSGPPAIPESIRRQMLELTFDELKGVEISDYEIERQNISYSYKTLLHFKQRYPNDTLFLVLGEDSFASFPQWVKIKTIVAHARIIVFPRKEQRPAGTVVPFDHGFKKEVEWLDFDVPDISATQIRNNNVETVDKNRWLHPDALTKWKAYCQSNNI